MISARPIRVLVPVLACALLGAAAGCGGKHEAGEQADAAAIARMEARVPANLRVKGPVIARVHAAGVQIYTAEVGKDNRLAWALTAPDATLSGDFKGRHTKGPTWECTDDGSKVEGRKVDSAPAPAPDAVDWLLLDAKSHSGEGRLSKVSFIQRLNTAGGKAPAAAPLKAGDVVRVPYTADYIFFGPGAKRADWPKSEARGASPGGKVYTTVNPPGLRARASVN